MADTSSLPLFQADVKHSPTIGHASPAFTTSVFQKTPDTSLSGLAAAPGIATTSSDNDVKKDQGPISAPSAANGSANGTVNGAPINGTVNGTTNGDSHAAEPLPLTEEPTTASTGLSANTPSPIPTGSAVEPAIGAAATGEKRKAEDEKEEDRGTGKNTSSGLPTPTPEAGPGNDGGEPAAKKAKTDAEAVSSGHSAPVAEVGLVSAPAPAEVPAAAPATATSDGDAGAKKSTKRTKREKKALPAVGKTARKTRSQGPVDA